MKVYMLTYIPFGAPAGDVDVLAVYDAKAKANKHLKQLIKDEMYADEELYILVREVK